jgi:hypothetical protein
MVAVPLDHEARRDGAEGVGETAERIDEGGLAALCRPGEVAGVELPAGADVHPRVLRPEDGQPLRAGPPVVVEGAGGGPGQAAPVLRDQRDGPMDQKIGRSMGRHISIAHPGSAMSPPVSPAV